MVKDGIVQRSNSNFGERLPPLKTTVHASARHFRRYRVTAEDYPENYGIEVRSVINS